MTTTTIPIRMPAASRPAGSRPVASRPSAAVYRRRRLVVAVLGALFVLCGARAADAVVGAAGSHVHDATKVVHYQVQPGDTLWSIAHRLAPNSDPREVVDLLVQAHGSSTIQPGDTIDWAGT
jgi:hypothetical protein